MDIHLVEKGKHLIEAVAMLDSEFAKLKERKFLFMISGGSSFELLKYLKTENFGPHSTVTVLDERFSEDESVNNFAQLTKTDFYERVKENGCNFIDTHLRQNETMENLAKRFEKALWDWVKENNSPIIATIGIGKDSHISGIMPYPENPKFFEKNFNNDSKWVTAYDAKDKNPYSLRVTTTLPFLRKIDFAVSAIREGDKKKALGKLTKLAGSLNENPCRIIREIKNVQIFTGR